MDSLTAVIAALYSSSVTITHYGSISVGDQSCMICDTYFSKRFRVFEKDRMFSTTVMDAWPRKISHYDLAISKKEEEQLTHETACDLSNCKQLAIVATVSGLCLPRREL